MPAIYPYTITNSQKGGFFMRTYNRNVRRAWDGDDYRAPKRQKLDFSPPRASKPTVTTTNENSNYLHLPGDTEDNLERAIRETSVAAMSSSPSRKNSTVFSFEQEARHEPVTLTPPSSPPPMLDITPPALKQRKPTFSALEKKKRKEKERLQNAIGKRKREDDDISGRDDSEPLSEIMNSSSRVAAQLAQAPAPSSNSFQPVQPPARVSPNQSSKMLTQTVLDFGQSNQPITCVHCQMSYTPSVPEDAKLHEMYHDRHKNGIVLDKAFMKSAMKWCYEVPNIPGSVVVVDRKISLPARRTVQKVLEVVNRELGSVEIPETELWGQKMLEGEAEDAKKVDCYKVFLHVIDGRCVAVCLAERIARAYKIKSARLPGNEEDQAREAEKNEQEQEREPAATSNKEDPALLTPTSLSHPENLKNNFQASSADLQHDSEPTEVIVGVSRIWTSATFRKKGIAHNLLDVVTQQFIYGLDIEKEDVAFSQPTDMGTRLATGWFGAESGWCVYREA